MQEIKLGKYLTLDNFCTCTNTYLRYAARIDPSPKNPDATIPALQALNQFILDPVIDYFGKGKFQLTYGFCSPDLRRYLDRKDPATSVRNGRIASTIDQHMAHEVKSNGNHYCERLGAACDFLITDLASDEVVEWVLQARLPFDSLYFYGASRPIHLSYGPQHKRDIWTFTLQGQPTKKGLEHWIKLASFSDVPE